MSDGDRCEWCKQSDQPPAVVPYLFYTKLDKPILRWLHQSPCSGEAHAAYVEKRRQWAAEGATDDA